MTLIRLLKYDLAKEVSSWVEEGIISTGQASRICARYGLDFHNLSRRSYGYRVLVALGYLFAGLSLITLVSANWEDIPRAVRMLGLMGLTLATNLLGLRMFRREDKSAFAWFFLGSLFYGASIMLIAQIYHIDAHFPDGIFWWAMGVLPIALLTGSTLMMLLAVCLGFTWAFVEASLDFYPLLFPVFLAAAFLHLCRGKQSNILFMLLVVGLVFWSEYTLAWFLSNKPGFRIGAENLVLCIGLFLLFHALAKLLVQKKAVILGDYGTLLGLWVLRFLIVTLFVFSFSYPWGELMSANWKLPAAAVGGGAVLFASSAVWVAFRTKEGTLSTAAFAAVYLADILAVLAVHDRNYVLIFQFATNVVLAATGVLLVTSGIRKSISHYFFLGVFTLLTTGFLRYIDLVGDYVGTAVLFGILAAILLTSARYWKRRSASGGGPNE
ncbi:MAG: DUF2157 domain-containing protein [Desulfobacteraceae bacterium]|nr:DUF2157 domain-containing protein [Desulfobacteraceae bacterium]